MKKSTEKLFYSIIVLILVTALHPEKFYAQTENYPPNGLAIIPGLNLKDTDLRDVMRSIALEYETNIVVENEIEKRISVSLFKICVFDAVEIIALDNGLEFNYDDKRFYISKKKEIEPPPPPPPEKEKPVVNYANGKLSLTLDEVEISIFVNLLISATNKNFLLSKGTSGYVSGSLSNVDLEIGLKNLLQNNGYYLTNKDSIFYISNSAYFYSNESNTDSRTQPYWVSVQDGKITLDVTNTDLSRIVTDLTNQLGLQIIKLTEISATVNVKCKEVPIKSAFEYLFKGTNYAFKFKDGVYIIGDKTSKLLEDTRLVRLNYLRAEETHKKLPASVIQGVNVGISLEHNGLVLTGVIENLDQVEDFLSSIDQPVPQVLIEALVVDFNLDDIYSFGINAGIGDSATLSRNDTWYPHLDVTASGKKINQILTDIGVIDLFGTSLDVAKLGKLPDDFYVNVRAMEQKGFANIQSKPMLSTLNGHTASLKIGTVQNYVFKEVVPIVNAVNSTFIEKERIEKIEAIISFEITPWVGANGELTLEIKPNFETPVGQFSPDKQQIPAINTRSFSSTIRLKDGETIVLGGVIQESETNTEDKFPILGDIPFIGDFLFSNVDKRKSKGELMIYITPRIYYGDDYTTLYNKVK